MEHFESIDADCNLLPSDRVQSSIESMGYSARHLDACKYTHPHKHMHMRARVRSNERSPLLSIALGQETSAPLPDRQPDVARR